MHMYRKFDLACSRLGTGRKLEREHVNKTLGFSQFALPPLSRRLEEAKNSKFQLRIRNSNFRTQNHDSKLLNLINLKNADVKIFILFSTTKSENGKSRKSPFSIAEDKYIISCC